MKDNKTGYFWVISALFLFSNCSQFISSSFSHKNNGLYEAIATVWKQDTCGSNIGDRNTVAAIMNEYLNSKKPQTTIREIAKILGAPDEIRVGENGIRYFYYFVFVKNCNNKTVINSIILDVTVNKQDAVLGSSMHIWEPEDN
ncbi:MAG: hypothetical protein WCR52_15565 [Bacteroidota bacterium]